MKQMTDGLAAGGAGTGILGLLGYVPEILAAVASACAIAWYAIRFYHYWKTKKLD